LVGEYAKAGEEIKELEPYEHQDIDEVESQLANMRGYQDYLIDLSWEAFGDEW
jgi:hypothetical protein